MKALTEYVRLINVWLDLQGKRDLTKLEQIHIIEHLEKIADKDKDTLLAEFKMTNLRAILCIEATRIASQIHPDLETPTEEKIEGAYNKFRERGAVKDVK